MIEYAKWVVAAIGALVAVLSMLGSIAPARLSAHVRTAMRTRWGMPLAVGMRVLLGGALLLAASASRYELAFRVIGWIALIAAVALIVIGRTRALRLLDAFDRLPALAVRLWLVAGAAFGLFLVDGALRVI